MATLEISIRDDLMDLVNQQVSEGRYASPDAYVQALLEREGRRRRAKRTLEAKLQEAVDDGPGEPLTPDEWDSMRREAIEGLAGEDDQP
jgi:Arc/MetJ-type ribon-helix-helix transcriptional regulator